MHIIGAIGTINACKASWIFLSHISFSSVMLMLGPLQLMKSIRRTNIQAHRVMGYIYYLMLYPASAGAFWLSFYAFGGAASTVGFALLATSWVATGFVAFIAIKERRIQDHKEWMLRNYALTFSAVSLRIMLIVNLASNGFQPSEAGYSVIAWACWIVNLIVMEAWIRFVERPTVAAAELLKGPPASAEQANPAAI